MHPAKMSPSTGQASSQPALSEASTANQKLKNECSSEDDGSTELDIHYSGISNFEGLISEGGHFLAVTFDHCSLIESTLKNCIMHEVDFIGCEYVDYIWRGGEKIVGDADGKEVISELRHADRNVSPMLADELMDPGWIKRIKKGQEIVLAQAKGVKAEKATVGGSVWDQYAGEERPEAGDARKLHANRTAAIVKEWLKGAGMVW